MAKIEDLVVQIPDERLKKAIGAEVRELKKNKKFGLVFEEHLPETLRLPKLPVKQGELVAKKRESGNELWRVKSIRKGSATLERAVEGYPLPSEIGVEVPVNDLVVVRSFGDPIYPALVPVDRVARGGPDSHLAHEWRHCRCVWSRTPASCHPATSAVSNCNNPQWLTASLRNHPHLRYKSANSSALSATLRRRSSFHLATKLGFQRS